MTDPDAVRATEPEGSSEPTPTPAPSISVKLQNRPMVQPINLPSKGLPYGGNLPGGKVFISAITTKEEKIFTAGASSGDDKMDYLFNTCVDLGKELTTARLVLPDRFFLLISLRALSYGNKYGFQFRCEGCNHQFRYEMNIIKDLEYTEVPDDWSEPFYVTLPMSGKRVGLCLLRGKDEKEIAQVVDKKSQSAVAEVGSPSYSLTMSRPIVEVDGQALDPMKALAFYEGLVALDGIAIRDKIAKSGFGYNPEVNIVCPSCGFRNYDMLPVDTEFFRPKFR